MQQSLWFHQLKHWWTCHIGETPLFTAGCQSLVFPSACFGEESFRSLNPNFSRGSLFMSWLTENTDNMKRSEECRTHFRLHFSTKSLTAPFGIPSTLWTASDTWSCQSPFPSSTSWISLWRLYTHLKEK